MTKKKFHLNKLPLKSYLLYICIALFLTTGVTFSKYIATTSGADSARAASFGNLSLYETANGAQVYENTFIYTPGVGISKDPMVDFSGGEVAAYIFVAVTAPGWDYQETDSSFHVSNSHQPDDTDCMRWSVDTNNWNFLLNDAGSNTCVLYRYTAPGDSFKELHIIKNDTIHVPETIKNSDMKELSKKISLLSFQAYAVQAGGFESPEAAWQAISGKQ